MASSGLLDQITAPGPTRRTVHHHRHLNLPAVFIISVVTALLMVGIKESATFNNVIVIIKVAVVILFIVGAAARSHANWHRSYRRTPASGHFGWRGVIAGRALSSLPILASTQSSTAAQEAKNPQRDMPIAIIGSLLICTVLYILVSGIATGVVPTLSLMFRIRSRSPPTRRAWAGWGAD